MKITAIETLRTAEFADLIGVRIHVVMPVIENGFALPLEGPGLGTEPLPAVFECSDLTPRRSEPV